MECTKFSRRFVVYNQTKKEYTGLRVLAYCLNIDEHKFINICETELKTKSYIQCTDNLGNIYRITILKSDDF